MHQRLHGQSDIAKHAWTEDNPIRWGDTSILQHASQTMELVIKEAIRIRMTLELALQSQQRPRHLTAG